MAKRLVGIDESGKKLNGLVINKYFEALNSNSTINVETKNKATFQNNVSSIFRYEPDNSINVSEDDYPLLKRSNSPRLQS